MIPGLLRRVMTCPACGAALNAFRGVPQCPNCGSRIVQRPRAGVVTGVFLAGWLILAIAGFSLGATFEGMVAVLLLWGMAMAVWVVMRPWEIDPARE
jgi:DNA-directed RNA polymerase subunit RPC12/RpoP